MNITFQIASLSIAVFLVRPNPKSGHGHKNTLIRHHVQKNNNKMTSGMPQRIYQHKLTGANLFTFLSDD